MGWSPSCFWPGPHISRFLLAGPGPFGRAGPRGGLRSCPAGPLSWRRKKTVAGSGTDSECAGREKGESKRREGGGEEKRKRSGKEADADVNGVGPRSYVSTFLRQRVLTSARWRRVGEQAGCGPRRGEKKES
ncbi:hypothetical protein PICMEDRAFT_100845 [Pichia membranifaciens NRRL Y-2026]|uniref:Uncharacterized protein n=1 Tax=Pichia membranifaciens NRRL Y-2026 TaxID=763406 RepID=A0A1E3NTF7_9ASCO|nr:hypothetical protein PICMEDRAFT_100845 [Pichia membranifaciens NRRL Y-2026]ODQ49391.1 hypothetical protein PICMEDRAFT_100845 [Pichia membranifaciens NRRL Y-2026]